jgi:DNA-binding Lrp family transcriptional regulator
MFKLIKDMSPADFGLFIAARRSARTAKIYRTLKAGPEAATVGTIAKDLGISKDEILKRLEKELLK